MPKRIGEILLDQGNITEGQLHQALERQSSSPDTKWLGQILVEMGAINDEAVAQSLASQHNFTYVDPSRASVDPALVWKVPRDLAEKHLLLPLRYENESGQGPVCVAMADPRDLSAIQDIEFLLRNTVVPLVASASAVRQAIHRHYDMAPDAQRLLSGVEPQMRGPLSAPTSLELDQRAIRLQLRAGGVKPYINLLNYLLLNSIERGASDIHLEPGKDDMRVRFRVDGMLREVLRLPRWAEPPLITRIKVVGELDVSMHRRPQDGKVAVTLGDKRVDMRISIIPSQYGERVVIRLLDPDMLVTDLGVMGWQPRALSSYYRMVSAPQGLVLVVGPTGSGKSTTLYGSIARLRAENTSIVTVEDPIEYSIDGITQIQVDEKADMTFSQSVRSILRQDPNVIVIGEIRDLATGKAAVEAANTGHLVLSTLHTGQTVTSINRLLEIGIQPPLLASSLLGIVAQRLLRRVCSECSLTGPVEEEDWHRLDVQSVDLGAEVHRPGPGCPRCQYVGYSGRVGVFEVLQVSEDMKEFIRTNASESYMWRQARAEGFTTLFEDALLKVHQGITTMEEVARVIPIDPWRKRKATVDPNAANPGQIAAALEKNAAPWRPLWASAGIDSAITGLIASNAPPPPEEAFDEADTGDLAIQIEAAPEPTPITLESYEEPSPTSSDSDERDVVLVVDDADEVLQLVTLTLEDTYEIETASDGEEGLEKVRSVNPALVVLDVMMPKMSGYDVCLQIKEDAATEHIPVIMLSARGEKAAVAKGFYAGADDYLPKPFDPEELLLRIRALIRRGRRQRR